MIVTKLLFALVTRNTHDTPGPLTYPNAGRAVRPYDVAGRRVGPHGMRTVPVPYETVATV